MDLYITDVLYLIQCSELLVGRQGHLACNKSEWCGADWSKVQTCIWPSWCHCHSLSPASVKSRLVLPFCYRLTRLVLDKGQLNVCVCFVFDSAADVHDCSHTYSIVLRIILFWGWHSSFELQKKIKLWGSFDLEVWLLSYSFNSDWKNLELTGQNSTTSNKTHQCRHGSVILQYIMNWNWKRLFCSDFKCQVPDSWWCLGF